MKYYLISLLKIKRIVRIEKVKRKDLKKVPLPEGEGLSSKEKEKLRRLCFLDGSLYQLHREKGEVGYFLLQDGLKETELSSLSKAEKERDYLVYEEISFENSAEIMDMTQDCARRMGMGPYYMYRQKNIAGNFENVGYSREGKAGIYNILIMEEKQSILAAGAGASTKFVFQNGERIERVENVKDLKNYVKRIDEMIERKRKGIRMYLRNGK